MADWTPYYLPNKLLWLRAADLVGTVDDGAEVLTWSDKSGNGFDATGSEGSAPTLDVDGFNGHPTLALDGTEYLATADLGASGDFTVFIVGNATGTADGYIAYLSSGIKISIFYIVPKLYFYDSVGVTQTVLSSSASSIYGITLEDGEYPELRVDGELKVNSLQSVWSNSTSINVITIGGISGNHVGDIAEIIIINAALSDADREKVEGYLAHDYGLESELPEDHTYYSAAPQIDYRETWFSGNIPHGDFIRGATGTDPSSQVIFGTPVAVSFSTSAGTSAALTSQIVRLQSTVDVRLDFGAAPSPSSGHGMFLPANTQEMLYLTPGTKIGAVGAASGTLYIEQSLEV